MENDLAPGEVVVSVEIPVTPALRRSRYLKVRDRASYEFAAASAAVGLDTCSQAPLAIRMPGFTA